MKGKGKIKFNRKESNIQKLKTTDNLENQNYQTEEEQLLNELITKTSRVLIRTSGIFPFDFFPDELTVDENKVSIVHRGLIDENIYSIQTKDLGDVSVEISLLFASLTITDNRLNHPPITIKWLDPDEAVRSRNIIQGLILGESKEIDFAKIKTEDLIKKVEELGQIK